MGDELEKMDLHAFYKAVDNQALQKACSEALQAGDKEEAHFWRGVLNAYLQAKQRQLVEAGEYYG